MKRKYTEKDIESMLSKTEKTDGKFNKKIDFPLAPPVIYRRRNYTAILIAACLTVILVSSAVIFAISNRDGNESEFTWDESLNSFVPYVSNPEVGDSEYIWNSSVSNIYGDDNSKDILATESGTINNSSDSSGTDISDPSIFYPVGNESFLGQGLKDNETVEEFFIRNPFEHLEARIKLPVYERKTVDEEYKNGVVNIISTTFTVEFNEELIDAENNVSLSIGDYGDWSLNYLSFHDGIVVRDDYEQAFISEARRFVSLYSNLFGTLSYDYNCYKNGSAYNVIINLPNSDDNIFNKLPVYTIEFVEVSENKFVVSSLKRNFNECSLNGEFETILFDEALNQINNGEFYTVDGFEPANDDSFVILGYDVRFIWSEANQFIIPYYAILIETNNENDSQMIHTLFVPAI